MLPTLGEEGALPCRRGAGGLPRGRGAGIRAWGYCVVTLHTAAAAVQHPPFKIHWGAPIFYIGMAAAKGGFGGV